MNQSTGARTTHALLPPLPLAAFQLCTRLFNDLKDVIMILGSLEVELLFNILEYVDEASPHTIKSLSLVNKHIHATARRLRFRRQSVDFTDPRKAGSHLSAYFATPEALRNIRQLTILGHWRREIGATFESLAKLVRSPANLRCIIWRYTGPIPIAVLDASVSPQGVSYDIQLDQCILSC